MAGALGSLVGYRTTGKPLLFLQEIFSAKQLLQLARVQRVCFVDHAVTFTTEQLRAGDPKATAEAKRYFYGQVRLALSPRPQRISKEDVEDIAAHAIPALLRKYLHSGRTVEELMKLLPTIARNRCADLLDERKTLKRGGDKVERIEDQPPGTEFKSESPDPAQQCEQLEKALAVRNAVRRLPVFQRQVIEYRFFDGLSNKDIAARLFKTENDIAQIVYRAKKTLKPILRRLGLF